MTGTPATIERHRLTNAHGIMVELIPLGGTITSIWLPDRNGDCVDVVPGFDTVEEYRADGRYFGALIGRFANRIARGRFRLDGVDYQLPLNDGPNHLHGGPNGFNTYEWRVTPFHRDTASGVVLCRRSANGEEGYPGTLITRVMYTLSDDDTFRVDYSAVTDAPTIVNLTQHTYFNLRGHDRGDVLGHELAVNASHFTPIDDTSIPTGDLRRVLGTPFDFTSPSVIGERISGDDEQLRIVGGYDHNYQLRRHDAREMVTAARLHDRESGRVVEIATTEPGLQVYTGNTMDRGGPGKGGCRYTKHAAIALETQHFPDSPNQPQFPSTVLRPGDEFVSSTVYRFGVTSSAP
jgi:aldose 1-epimerase